MGHFCGIALAAVLGSAISDDRLQVGDGPILPMRLAVGSMSIVPDSDMTPAAATGAQAPPTDYGAS
jgi:hypothetical protein